MAGSYPDVPGYRFAYDTDGTVLVSCATNLVGPITTYDNAFKSILNQNSASVPANLPTFGAYLIFIFPEPRTITGYFLNIAGAGPPNGIIQTSDDTTTGLDGTWTTQTNSYSFISNSSTSPTYRTSIEPVDWQDITAVRVATHNWGNHAIHFYGYIADTESPDRLRVVDTSDDDIAAQLDFGNIPQRSSVTKQFKVINNSTTQTADNITVSVAATAHSDASPTLVGQYQVSTDNVAFANSVNIGDLGPEESSGTLYLRNAVADTAQLGLWTARITASAAEWS